MPREYTIVIKNESGDFHNYCLFSEPPQVDTKSNLQIWSNIFHNAEIPNKQSAEIDIHNDYFAICGHSDGGLADEVAIKVGGSVPVVLGTKKADGSLDQPGTTLALQVDHDVPKFSDTPLESKGMIGCFEIATSSFDLETAQEDNWIIGVGGGQITDVPFATFMPEPNANYQIQPVHKYYLAFGEVTLGAIVNTKKFGTSVLPIDFTTIHKKIVTVIHNSGPDSKLVIQD